jgi:phenylacetate-CoA ligase
MKVAMVGARNATHMSSAMPQTFYRPGRRHRPVPGDPADRRDRGPVDLAGRPVPPGVRSDKLPVTTLADPTLPLIRYELTDQVTVLDRACPCGSAHTLIADVQGRMDDAFAYPGGQVVHPHVFRSVVGRERGVVEYQVGQTPDGAEVLVVGALADPAAVGRRLAAELAGLGLPAPSVEVRPVDRLERQATGKVRRFRPLEAAARPA